jgi:hypothetical protein
LTSARKRAPWLLVDEVDDEAAKVCRILDFVLRFPENDAEHARLFAEIVEGIAVVPFERQAVEFDTSSAQLYSAGIEDFLPVRRARTLVVHLKEEKIGELLDVVAVGNAVVPEQVAVVPDFVDEIGGGGGHQAGSGGAITVSSGNTSKSFEL